LNSVRWRNKLADSVPFYYGWAIFASTVSVSLSSRTIMAVATLSSAVERIKINLQIYIQAEERGLII